MCNILSCLLPFFLTMACSPLNQIYTPIPHLIKLACFHLFPKHWQVTLLLDICLITHIIKLFLLDMFQRGSSNSVWHASITIGFLLKKNPP